MKCPGCNTENPDIRKFCRECGAKIVLVCINCRSENLLSEIYGWFTEGFDTADLKEAKALLEELS